MNGEEELATAATSDADLPAEAIEDFAPRRTVDWGRSVTTFIAENPEASLGIALALGVAIGILVKRR